MSISLTLDVELDQKTRDLLGEKPIERATSRTVERLINRIEDTTLIRQYTQSAKPAKPVGSTYVRTFRLRHSSQKKMISKKLPAIEGQWQAKTKYASAVIGLVSQQSEIHKGRWPSLELAINIVEKTAQKVFDEEIKKESA